MIKHENRSFIEVRGKDSFQFLQSIITNDVDNLHSKSMIYSLILTAQGKYLYDFFIYNLGGFLLIDANSIFANELFHKLNIYKLRSDVSLKISNDYEVFYSNHEQNNAVISELDSRNSKMRFRNLFKNNEIQEFQLTYDEMRINNGVSEGHSDLISGKSFPLEFAMDQLNAVSFNKGCYIGQEVVARSKYRGVIRKKPYLAEFYADCKSFDMLQFGDKITMNGKAIGILCSFNETAAISLIRDADLEENFTNSDQIYANNVKIKLNLISYDLGEK